MAAILKIVFLFFYWILGFDMGRLLYRLGYTCLDSAAAEALISCQASYLSQNFTKTSSALLLLSFLWRCWLDVSKGELAYKNTAWVMSKISLTLYGHIKTTERRTVIQQYDDWYTGRSLVGCYIWYSEEGSGQAGAPHRSLLPVPNVTAHRSTTSVPDRAEHHIKVVRYNRTVEIIVHLWRLNVVINFVRYICCILRYRQWNLKWHSEVIQGHWKWYHSSYYYRTMLCISAVDASCGVRLSVRLSITFVDHVKTNKHNFEIFHHRVATPF